MGLAASLLYIFLNFLSPVYLVPELAPYGVMNYVAGLATLCTIFTVTMNGFPTRAPQNMSLAAFTGCVLVSWLWHGYLGGALFAVINFGPTIIVFFLFAANAFNPTRVKITVLLVLGISAFYAVSSILAYHFGIGVDTFLLFRVDEDGLPRDELPRVRGTGVFEDPNELGQLLVVSIALLGLFWKKRSATALLVLFPLLSLFVYSCYLTRSRGTMLGLVALLLVWFIQRGKRTLGLLLGAAAGVVMMALNFTGGRSVGVESGSDRIMAWGQGLDMFKQSPLVGVGYNGFLEHAEMTAHNSFILCLAELGLVGCFLWVAAFVISILEMRRFLNRARDIPEAQEWVAWIRTFQMALTGWMVTGWFLSRTYSHFLYLLLGLIAAVMNMAWKQIPEEGGRSSRQIAIAGWAPYTAGAVVVLIVMVYGLIRLNSFIKLV